ncbi:MAG: type 1 glutamine amidotransferase [Halanaeroarchaeum sp.]
MTSRRVVLLDGSIGDTPAERNFRREVDAPIDTYKVSEGDLPPSPSGTGADEWPYDAAIISGSQASVYDDEAWIDDAKAWVREAIDASIPVLGVCWGHQLIASALGGTVEYQGRYEIGYRSIEIVADDPLFEGIGREFVAFETHSDGVTELPAGATVLAENDCTVQSFRIDSAYGVQFHPEYDLETTRWIVDGKELQPERERAVRADLTQERYEEAREATRVFDNFLEMADESVTTTT